MENKEKNDEPKPLCDRELYETQFRDSNDYFWGYDRSENGQLVCKKKDIEEAQLEDIKTMYREIGKVELMGGVANFSLSLKVCEPRSLLDRLSEGWRMAPHFLTPAAESRDPEERLKFLVSFAISGLPCFVGHYKPLMPLLGETLQAHLEDGTEIYLEQIASTPPETCFLLINPLYRMFGRYKYILKSGPNAIKLKVKGKTSIQFTKDGGEISYTLPTIKISDALFGERKFQLCKKMKFLDSKNLLKAIVFFDCGKATGFLGSRSKDVGRDKFDGLLYQYNPAIERSGIELIVTQIQDISKKIESISGSWLSNLNFGSKPYWTLNQDKPVNLTYSATPLPSDWRFRQDLIHFRRSDFIEAEKWRSKLEADEKMTGKSSF